MSDSVARQECAVLTKMIRPEGSLPNFQGSQVVFFGFLKPAGRLFTNPLRFADGAIHLSPGYQPQLDPDVLERTTVEIHEFS